MAIQVSSATPEARAFFLLWGGQFVTRIGTALTRFALLIWVYEQTDSATALALLGFFAFLPALVVSPVAGVWVDRLPRRAVLLGADAAAGGMTLLLLLLYRSDGLAIWHLYALMLLAGACEAFQGPAYSAATTLLLPKAHYGRAAGLRFVADNGALVIAPFAAGLLLPWIGLVGVMLVDLLTVVVALGTLWWVRLPEPDPAAGQGTRRPWQQDIWVGLRYLRAYPGLLGLTLIFMGLNFIAALTYYSTLPALILARSGGSVTALAWVQGALGAAGVVGALGVSIWGGPRRKLHGILLGAAASFLLGDLVLALGRTLPLWVAGAAIGAVVIPLIGGSNEAIWQAKVPPAHQGRVFATKNMLGQLLSPLGYLLGGVLADRWFEPALATGGVWQASLGWLVGEGPGAGLALMFVITSLAGTGMALAGYGFRAIREVEDLPDHAPFPADAPTAPSTLPPTPIPTAIPTNGSGEASATTLHWTQG